MKKIYKNIQLEVVYFQEDDIVRTSSNDNLEEMPDFPALRNAS